MSTNYEPGTVAVATIQGESVRVVAGHDGDWIVFGHSFFKSIAQGNDHYITDVRPLVVLDPYVDSERLQDLYTVAVRNGHSGLSMHAALIEFEKPPRIPEPGLWGVVEATIHGDEMPRLFLRDTTLDEDGHWVGIGGGHREEWDDLIHPTLIREGVES